MKMRVVLPLILALIAGLGCLIVLRQVLDDTGNPRTNEAEQTKAVLVAVRNLEVAQEIEEIMLEVKAVPVSMIPEGTFAELPTVVGRVLRTNVPAGFPVTADCVHPEGYKSGFESQIPPGYRAYTIKVDEWSSVSGFVVPGSRVDVIAEVRDENTRRKRSNTILQNVVVAAVGSATSREDLTGDKGGSSRTAKADRRAVTLFLTPREVEIVHENRSGRLNLALRSGADDSTYESEPETEQLIAMPMIPAPVEQAAPPVVEKAPPKPQAPERTYLWEINGNTVEQVFYVKLGGVWHRETASTRSYATDATVAVDTTPMPQLKQRLLPGDDSAADDAAGETAEDDIN